MSELPEHVRINREYWDSMADNWVALGERNWAKTTPTWGIWATSDFDLLPADMTGMEAIELGCGTGYVSAWMARRGARVVGIDNSASQLDTARRLAAEHGVELELIHGNAETVPYPDESFDFAISEYGAALWADPAAWLPEAWRLLRPGGGLAFFTNHPLAPVCSPLDGSLPITERLERPYFGMYRFDWRDAVDDPGGIEFNMPISDWFHLLADTGFVVADFIEVRAPHPGRETRDYVTADWAYQWPPKWRGSHKNLRRPTLGTGRPKRNSEVSPLGNADGSRTGDRTHRPLRRSNRVADSEAAVRLDGDGPL